MSMDVNGRAKFAVKRAKTAFQVIIRERFFALQFFVKDPGEFARSFERTKSLDDIPLEIQADVYLSILLFP